MGKYILYKDKVRSLLGRLAHIQEKTAAKNATSNKVEMDAVIKQLKFYEHVLSNHGTLNRIYIVHLGDDKIVYYHNIEPEDLQDLLKDKYQGITTLVTEIIPGKIFEIK